MLHSCIREYHSAEDYRYDSMWIISGVKEESRPEKLNEFSDWYEDLDAPIQPVAGWAISLSGDEDTKL